ncbi:chemotaxis protein CheW [Marichromatium sp. AB32]|uniref:chemotaxis protein CheW n=1 Tax=Marichromatium sp. AB32 TaxID=2483363 RepID=UPI000F3BB832|nr:chemotaxis protein CheW [Marichromatium sp. AB32]MBO8086442.1 chemotaxis protein CheW [Marichromatium sp.]RNE92861.1 chemotaxis protein CheA [Marichromatium sp. AB32]
MTIDMTRFYQVFFDEAGEHLAEMETLLLELDIEAPDPEVLNAIFRAAHSIKGGAGTFGFHDVARVTHILETLLDRLRKHELAPTVEMIDATLQAGDLLKAQLAAHQRGEEFEDPQIAEVCARLEQLSQGGALETVPEPPAGPADPCACWRLVFAADLLGASGDEREAGLAAALAELGELERNVPADVPSDRLAWRLCTEVEREAIVEIFDFLCDPEEVEITREEQTGGGEEEDGFGFFEGAPGSDRGADQELDGFGLFGGSPGMDQVAETAERERDEQQQGFGFFETAPGAPEAAPPVEEPATPRSPPAAEGGAGSRPPAGGRRQPQPAPGRQPQGESSIRVSVEKVDQLINLVGELVITHAMLAESASALDPVAQERIFDGLANLERNSRDLQQAVMSIRMMPISFVFNRFPRVVRDTASALGKKVTLKLIGEDTELDKGLIERLADPLNHLVRNSIDHGIETAQQRIEQGKPETGEIVLAASHRGGNVVVEVSDDGAGLDRERLLAKAAERGVALPDNPTDKEVWQLIFAPGFSTAKAVTDISGRGVGMDVVRRNIEAMNGRVEIDSEPGRGTRITIRLPLTLAILDGMSVRVCNETFILPLTVIRESIRPQAGQCKTLAGKGKVVHVGEEYLPLVALHQIFGLSRQQVAAEETILVIIESNEGRAALQVDELLAQHQVVIKSLETNYRKVEGISGATIMGDGRVAMILDVDALVRLSRKTP